jgi:histidyl-tRNA synthetase
VPKIIIVGAKDLEEGKVTVKDMVSGDQELVELDNLITCLKEE